MTTDLKLKLDLLLQEDENIIELEDLLDKSVTGFSCLREFKSHLHEGSLLNVGVLASKALSIPCGEYMVWMTDAGHTMLVPTKSSQKEVYEAKSDSYDIFTNTLLQQWNKISKSILEEEDKGDNQQEQTKTKAEQDKEEERIGLNIDISTVDRKPILRAMEDRGYTVTSLADAVGVDPPAISRILRTPKDVQGDPQGRNPSMGLASQICSALRIDPTAAFPDIFGDKSKYKPKNVPANRGSGMGGAAKGSTKKGKATAKWTQGSNE